MIIPEKVFIPYDSGAEYLSHKYYLGQTPTMENVEYIRKDTLLKWVESEMNRLWKLLPDADNPNPTQMELRYLGQYMQMETLEDKLNLM